MDCPHKIPPSGKPVIHCKAHRGWHTRSGSRHHQEDWERRDCSRSYSRYSRYHSSSYCDLHRGCSRSVHKDRHSCHRSSSRQSHPTHQGHRHRSHHDTPHQSHHTHCSHSSYHSRDCSRTHCSSSGYCSQDHSRSRSQPPYHLSKCRSHQKGLCNSVSHLNLRNCKTHSRSNTKVQMKNLNWIITVCMIIQLTQERNWSL